MKSRAAPGRPCAQVYPLCFYFTAFAATLWGLLRACYIGIYATKPNFLRDGNYKI